MVQGANPESFSLFLHVAKFGLKGSSPLLILPRLGGGSDDDNSTLKQDASFWGVDCLYESMVLTRKKYYKSVIAKEAAERARLFKEYLTSVKHECGGDEERCVSCDRRIRGDGCCWKCGQCDRCTAENAYCPFDCPLEGEDCIEREHTTDELGYKLSSEDPCTQSKS